MSMELSMSNQDLYTLMCVRFKEFRQRITKLESENKRLNERLSIVEGTYKDTASIASSSHSSISLEDSASIPEKKWKSVPTFRTAPVSAPSTIEKKIPDITKLIGFDNKDIFQARVNEFTSAGKENRLRECKKFLLADVATGDTFFQCLIWSITNFMDKGFKANRIKNKEECKKSCEIVDKFQNQLIENKEWKDFFYPIIGNGNSDIIMLNREKVYPIHKLLMIE